MERLSSLTITNVLLVLILVVLCMIYDRLPRT